MRGEFRLILRRFGAVLTETDIAGFPNKRHGSKKVESNENWLEEIRNPKFLKLSHTYRVVSKQTRNRKLV